MYFDFEKRFNFKPKTAGELEEISKTFGYKTDICCPLCGHEVADSSQYNDGLVGAVGLVECEKCRSMFWTDRHTIYKTYKIVLDNNNNIYIDYRGDAK